MKAVLKDGQISIDLAALLEDETILAELAKSAVFDDHLIKCISQVLLTGQVDWEEGDTPWWSTWTGKGKPFEAARQIVAGLADQVAQKLINDLTNERDCQYAKREQLQREVWRLEAQIRKLRKGEAA